MLSLDTTAASKDGGYQSDTRNLSEDLVLYGARFDDPARAQGTPRILWTDGHDVVWDMDRAMPSTRFAPPGSPTLPVLVWVDAINDSWGTSDPVGGSLSEKPLESWAYNSSGFVEPAGSTNAGRGTFDITGLLPFAGVSDVAGHLGPGSDGVRAAAGRAAGLGHRGGPHGLPRRGHHAR